MKGFIAMTTIPTAYEKIAKLLREQKLPDAPVDHQREELLNRLAKMDDLGMREYGIKELDSIISGRQRHSHH